MKGESMIRICTNAPGCWSHCPVRKKSRMQTGLGWQGIWKFVGRAVSCGDDERDDPLAARKFDYGGRKSRGSDAGTGTAAGAGTESPARAAVGDFNLLRGGDGLYGAVLGCAVVGIGVAGPASAHSESGVGGRIYRAVFYAGGSGGNFAAGSGNSYGRANGRYQH